MSTVRKTSAAICSEPIAIVGTACRLPGKVRNLDDYWKALSTACNAIQPIPEQRLSQQAIYATTAEQGKSYAEKAGLLEHVDGFDAEFFALPQQEANAMDPQQRLLLETAWHALEDAAQSANKKQHANTGLYVGISTDDYAQLGHHSHRLTAINSYDTLGTSRAIAAGRIAYHLNLQGPVVQLDTACSSSLMAIHLACQSLRLNETDCAIAGGVNLLLSPQMMVALSQMKALSPSNCCHVFDAGADGYVRGEGCGLVVLKRLSDAELDSDRIIAVIRGSAVNHDGASNGLTAPNGLAQEALLQRALVSSGIDATEVNYIEAHGTGTLFGDPIEVNALAKIYGQQRKDDNPLFLGSVKANIGHLEAAAGVAGLLKVCVALQQRQLPPNLHFVQPNPHIKWRQAPLKVVTELQEWPQTVSVGNNVDAASSRIAAVSSFGFSGTNVHMIVQEYESARQTLSSANHSAAYLLPLSAKTPTALSDLVAAWLQADYLSEQALANISFTAATKRQHFKHRLLLLVTGYEDLQSKLAAWHAGDKPEGVWQSDTVKQLTITVSTIGKDLCLVANAYLAGEQVDWSRVYDGESFLPCRLPLYPFQHQNFWLDEVHDFAQAKPPITAFTQQEPEKQIDILYQLQWQNYGFVTTVQQTNAGLWLIVDDSNDNSDLIKVLQQCDIEFYAVSITEFLQQGMPEDAQQLIFSVDDTIDIEQLEYTLYKVWQVAQQVYQQQSLSRLWLITHQAQIVEDEVFDNPAGAAVWGMARALRLELAEQWGGIIDLPSSIDVAITKNLLQCLQQENDEDQYLLRGNSVYVPRLRMQTNVARPVAPLCQKQGAYLITGGLGALGLALADYFIQSSAGHVILVSRRGDQALAEDSVLAGRIDNWRQQGKRIDIHALDICDQQAVAGLFSEFQQQRIKIKGIAHAAGLIARQSLSEENQTGSLDTNQIKQLLCAKVQGARYLHQYSQGCSLDFMLLFSSVTAVWGMKHLPIYSAANAYLDALAMQRHQQGLNTLSINWGRFERDGMVNQKDAKALDLLGIKPLSLNSAFSTMTGQLQQHDIPQAIIISADWSHFVSYFKQLARASFFSEVSQTVIDTKELVAQIRQPQQLSEYLLALITGVLGMSGKNEIAIEQNLFELGLNSLLAMQIRQRLEQELQIKTTATLFFQQQSIQSLTSFLWPQIQHVDRVVEMTLPNAGKTAFLFSGQGTQYAGMGQCLYQRYDIFRDNVDLCCVVLNQQFKFDFKELLFSENAAWLSRTEYTQPALFVIEYALAKLWQHNGIDADYLIGHSVGEYVAACLANVFSLNDALTLITLRGRLMQDLPEEGAMLAVFTIAENLPALPEGLSIAAINSLRQLVLSGQREQLEAYRKKLLAQNITHHFLAVSHAFHSQLMQPILEEFRAAAEAIHYRTPERPLIANSDGQIAADNVACAEYWVQHIVATVNFATCIETVRQLGCQTFIEVGPGVVLINLIQQNLAEHSVACRCITSLLNEANADNDFQQQLQNLQLLTGPVSETQARLEAASCSDKRLLDFLVSTNENDRYLPFPLTAMQHAYWLGRNSAITNSSVAIHLYLEMDIQDFNKQHFIQAWRTLVKRHDMLRAVVSAEGQQRVFAEVPEFDIHESSQVSATLQSRANYLQKVRDELSHQNMSLHQWPQFEVRITYLPDNIARVHFSLDGWSLDGWSYQILFYELHRLYKKPNLELPELNFNFRDYVLQLQRIEQSQLYKDSLQQWRKRLSVLPDAPQLPMRKNVDGLAKRQFKRRQHLLSQQHYSALQKQAAKHALTPTTTMLAVYAWVLSRWSETPDISLNVPRFNRLPLHAEVKRAIGEFSDFTLLACRRTADTTFVEFALSLQQQLWENIENPWVPGVTLLRELAIIKQQGSVLMPYVFTNMPEETLDGQRLELLNQWADIATFPYFITQTPQVWIDCQYHEQQGELLIFWDCLADLFAPGLLDTLFNHYIDLLENLSEDEALWQQSDLILKTEPYLRQKQRCRCYNNTHNHNLLETAATLLHIPFNQQVQKQPRAVAVMNGQINLTYAALAQRAYALNLALQAQGIGPGARVAVVLEKGWEQVVAVLGILASGAAYVPIDPSLPAKRLQQLLSDAECSIAVSKKDTDAKLCWPETTLRLLVSEQPVENKSEALEIWPARQQPKDLAYIIYTSGSTGVPKGVMMDHQAVLNTVLDINQRFAITEKDKIFALSALNFDLSVYDIFGTLAAGGTLVIPDAGRERDPEHWFKKIQTHGVTVWNSVPALLQMLTVFVKSTGANSLDKIYTIMLSGDWIPLTLPTMINELIPNARLYSLGGATEAAIWSIYYPVDKVLKAWGSIPYGRPLANQQFYVLDSKLQTCPDYVAGDLYIGGDGLAQGYWGDKEKTNQRFIVHPKTGEALYHTGDLGRFHPEQHDQPSYIEFLGRIDHQVKLNGYRIELGEIEALLQQHACVKQVIVQLVASEPLNSIARQNLVAYIVADKNKVDEKVLRAFLTEQLPNYMLPAAFICIPSIPLSANGKLDRRALPIPDFSEQSELAETLEITVANPTACKTQSALMPLWKTCLQRDVIGVQENFFEAGGNSLLATELFVKIRTVFPQVQSVVNLYEHPTIAALADFILQEKSNQHIEPINRRGQKRRQQLLAKKRSKQSLLTEVNEYE